MKQFRSLADNNPHLINNFRPVQPLNGRKVLEMDSSGAGGSFAAVGLLLAAMLAHLLR